MPFFTETRTRSGFCSSALPSNDSARTTMRSVRSRSSRTSTKPAMATLPAGRARIGCATWTVFSVATAKPAATAVKASAMGNAIGRRRAMKAMTQQSTARACARPPRRLAVGGEIDRDAEPEGDRQPRQQASGAGVGDRPVAESLGGGPAEIGKDRRPKPARARRAAASHVPTRPRLPPCPCPNPPCATPPRALTLAEA